MTPIPLSGSVRSAPLLLLRLEAAALLIAAVSAYAWLGSSWWLFGLLFFAPDLSMIGYLANARTGAVAYNAAHTTLGPAVLAGAGFALGSPLAVSLAVIWVAHIGFDRALGFGLKYATAFADTHLGSLKAEGAAARL